MESSHIFNYINNPEQLGQAETTFLGQMTITYPYCQTFQLLFAKGLHNIESPRFSSQIKLAAAYAGNRGLLKKLIEKVYLSPDKGGIEENPGSQVNSKNQSNDKYSGSVVATNSLLNHEIDEEVMDLPVRDPEKSEQRSILIDVIRARLAEIQTEREVVKTTQEKVIQPIAELQIKEKGNDCISKSSLIERFIQDEPRMSSAKRDFFNPMDMAKQSSIDRDDVVSETLARVFVQQGDIPRAIKIYEKLCLIFPEKSGYFAAQIEKLGEKPR